MWRGTLTVALVAAACGRTDLQKRELSRCWPNCAEETRNGDFTVVTGTLEHRAPGAHDVTATSVGDDLALAYAVASGGTQTTVLVELEASLAIASVVTVGDGRYPALASDGVNLGMSLATAGGLRNNTVSFYWRSPAEARLVAVQNATTSPLTRLSYGAASWGLGFNDESTTGAFVRYGDQASILSGPLTVSNFGDCFCSPSAAWNGAAWGFAFENDGLGGDGYDIGFVLGDAAGNISNEFVRVSDEQSSFAEDPLLAWTGAFYDVMWRAPQFDAGTYTFNHFHARLAPDGTLVQPASRFASSPAASSQDTPLIGPSALVAVGSECAFTWVDGEGVHLAWFRTDGAIAPETPLLLAAQPSSSWSAAAATDVNAVVIFWPTDNAAGDIGYARVSRQ